MQLESSKSFEKYQKDQTFRHTVHALFSEAEPYIDKFAKTNNFKIDKWYLDLPIWNIRWKDGTTTRVIQIGAVPENETVSLSIIAHAYKNEIAKNLHNGIKKAIKVAKMSSYELKYKPDKIEFFLKDAMFKVKEISSNDMVSLSSSK